MRLPVTYSIDEELVEPFIEIAERKSYNRSKLISGFIRRFIETDGDIEYVMKSYNPNWRNLKSNKSNKTNTEGK